MNQSKLALEICNVFNDFSSYNYIFVKILICLWFKLFRVLGPPEKARAYRKSKSYIHVV